MGDVRRICLWSGPRNVSTAVLYAFAQRPDTRALDEPLYAHYLRVSDADHPGKADVLASMENDGERVVRDVILGPCDVPVLFMKQMAHHLVEIDRSFMRHTVNVILTRDPAEVVTSLARVLDDPTLRDTGFRMQYELIDQLRGLGQEPPVLDARELLLDPPGVLGELCALIGIPFDEAMLSWEPGPKPVDGVWAPHWYANVHRSTGFEPYRPKREPVPDRLKPLLDECQPYYESMYAVAIKARRDG
ncbi:sulfotransferase family protein [Candidatus Poribacteria bacterium]|nr:sulfotransferase family protein [Candidatus Poribacteria bacterium]